MQKGLHGVNAKAFSATTQSVCEKIILPLYSHKKDSDRKGKHEKWTARQHYCLTTGAILLDLGVGSGIILLAFFGNYLQAIALKIAHNTGAEIFPQAISDYLKK